jgi:hypothetical protein
VIFALFGVPDRLPDRVGAEPPSRLLMMFIALMTFEVAFLAVLMVGSPGRHRAGMVGDPDRERARGGRHARLLLRGLPFQLGRTLLGPWTRIAREGSSRGLLGRGVVVWSTSSTTSPRRECRSARPRFSARPCSTACASRRRSSSTRRSWPSTRYPTAWLHPVWLGSRRRACALADREPRLALRLSHIALFLPLPEVFTFVSDRRACSKFRASGTRSRAIAWWTISRAIATGLRQTAVARLTARSASTDGVAGVPARAGVSGRWYSFAAARVAMPSAGGVTTETPTGTRSSAGSTSTCGCAASPSA